MQTITIRVPDDYKYRWQTAAMDQGITLTEYIIKHIEPDFVSNRAAKEQELSAAKARAHKRAAANRRELIDKILAGDVASVMLDDKDRLL